MLVCKNKAILLLGVKNKKNIFLFLSESKSYPGLEISIDLSKNIKDQISQILQAKGFVKKSLKKFFFHDSFKDSIELDKKNSLPLYLVTLKEIKDEKEFFVNFNHCLFSMSEILMQMPKNRNRLPYLKVLQVLSAFHKDKIQALSFSDVGDLKNKLGIS